MSAKFRSEEFWRGGSAFGRDERGARKTAALVKASSSPYASDIRTALSFSISTRHRSAPLDDLYGESSLGGSEGWRAADRAARVCCCEEGSSKKKGHEATALAELMSALEKLM